MTNGAGDNGNEGQERWSEYEDAIERREELYRSGSTTFWDLNDLVKLWLEELHDVGLSALDPDSQAPQKQAEAQGPERSSLEVDERPVHLDNGKMLWLKLDGPRTERGYKSVTVSDEPLRTDAAIVAALAVLEAATVDKKRLDFEIKRLGALLRSHSDTPLKGPLTARVAQVAKQLVESEGRNADLQFLQEKLHLRFFEFVLALLRDRRPGFDDLYLGEQLDRLRVASSYVSNIVNNSLKLMKYLEYGTPSGLPTRTLETVDKRVEAAVLRDVAGLKPKDIADRFGIKEPPNFSIKKDYPEVRDLVNKGRLYLEEALGKDGWRERKKAMKAEMKWWQSLSKEKQWAEQVAEDLEHLIGPNPFGDVARRQVLSDDDPKKRKNRIRYDPFAR